MSGPMFGSSSTLIGSTDGNRHLVEFRAGRMTLSGTTVTADLRKGLVYLYRTETALVHFCWKDRNNGITEEDLLIFPDDCEFIRLTQCTTGRVYLLKFKTNDRRFFFWMQEPSATKDEELCKRVNDIMNNVANSSSRSDLQDVLSNLSHNQLMSLFSPRSGVRRLDSSRTPSAVINPRSAFIPLSVTPSRTSRTDASTSTSSPPTRSDNADQVPALTLSTPNQPINTTTPQAPIRVPTIRILAADPASTSATGQSSELQSFLTAMQALEPSTVSVDLSTVIAANIISEYLSDPDRNNVLFPHLPPIGTDESLEDQLRETILSAQFLEALTEFSMAIESGQLGPILSQFNLSNEAYAAANFGNLEAFVKALERAAIRAASTIEIIKQEEDDDEDMEDD